MSSKAAFLGLFAAAAGIASATHCTPRAMELGRWRAEFHDAPNCAGGSPEYFPTDPYPNSLDLDECSRCYSLGSAVSNHMKSFAFSAAEKSYISITLFYGSACNDGIIEAFQGNTARDTTNSHLSLASSFFVCRDPIIAFALIGIIRGLFDDGALLPEDEPR
ncbi:hypothetical protein BV22DRAFT_1133930 [Leucogyrophana mollusca]|uniref:Uncharacterized protein n=1 Tax=Leucogyrophana mollusca TaxID=85980 RepID=A0ACB8B0V0_9AGAM|nr:hypothetical protein BV22DRAFT_1133930 [Leucogyrophana mollusca]